MRKSIKLSLVAGAAGIALVAGAGAANAAVKPANTGSCGPQCFDLSYQSSGTSYVLRDQNGVTKANNPVNVNVEQATGWAGKAEDFLPAAEGTVEDLYCNTNGQPLSTLFTARGCQELINEGYGPAETFEEQYSPLGANSQLCNGLWDNEATATPGYRIRTVKCGVAADTVWIVDIDHSKLIDGHWYSPLINGASDNFADPLVVTESSGAPAYQTQHLQALDLDSHGFVNNRQLLTGQPGL